MIVRAAAHVTEFNELSIKHTSSSSQIKPPEEDVLCWIGTSSHGVIFCETFDTNGRRAVFTLAKRTQMSDVCRSKSSVARLQTRSTERMNF